MSSDDVATEDVRMTRPWAGRVEVRDVPLVADRERYEALGMLGTGGMGEVRLYRDKRIARQVAVKVLRPGFSEQPGYRARLVLEARLQGQLEHPSIVPVHDLGETPDGELYFSMTRVHGVTLRAALTAVRGGDRSPRFARRRLLTAFSSVCLAVDFAHRRGVVHRDLKPENIMLGEFGEVFVLDWGIAKVLGEADDPHVTVEVPPGTDTPTVAGTVLGTHKYMAPERRQGQTDPRSDVYSLGVILAEILVNEPALDTPPELSALTDRAMEDDLGRRFQTPRALHDALEHYLDGDRDLERRRALAEQHVRRAEEALAGGSREIAGREIGRALGLQPEHPRAVGVLMRMITEMPAQLPAQAEAELERSWRERRTHTLRAAMPLVLSPLALVPFYLWLGVLSGKLLALYIALAAAAIVLQWYASRPGRPVDAVIPLIFVSLLGALVVMSTSMGMLGPLPGAFVMIGMSWRMVVKRVVHGLLIVSAMFAAILAPFVLAQLGIVGSAYSFRDGSVAISPAMHAFPATKMLVTLVMTTLGVTTVALQWVRIYQNRILQAERTLTFQAWQLQQLVPADAVKA